MTTTLPDAGDPGTLRRPTGALFVAGAVSFAAAASILSATFDWPDILREDAGVVLPAFLQGGPTLVWIWFATAWAYALLLLPVLLLPRVLGQAGNPVLRVATIVGSASVVFSLVGFLRWVFVVPALARSWESGDTVTRAAVEAAWLAQHQFGGALLGEHLGQLGAIAWSVTIGIFIIRTGALPRWLGWFGVVSSLIYLLNQGDILATAVPGFPVLDIAGPVGSGGWGLWVVALGLALLARPLGLHPGRVTPATATLERIGA